MSVFDHPAFDAHEDVGFCHDAPSGLSAIIALHSTARGPAAGGCRLWHYDTADDALYDVLRLAKSMSYKNAMANLPLGGGKAVILKPTRIADSTRFFSRFGDFVESFSGRYITAEDMGMSESIMQVIAARTSFVTGLPNADGAAGGDPSPKTALGIFTGIRAAVEHRFGDPDLRGKRIAIQGVGNVGYNLATLLHRSGASLLVADMDDRRCALAQQSFDAEVLPLSDILFSDVDVLSPCATGAVLNAETIPQIRAPIIAGGANNQLATDADGERLRARGILYAPDYVINAGGIINVSCEYAGGFQSSDVDAQVLEIGPRLTQLFETADVGDEPTNRVADRVARELIANAKT